jgi:branched-chain amino acid transport system permease protein
MRLRLLSGDAMRSRSLALLLVLVVAGLALAPFLFPGARALDVAAKICVFIVLVASFDLLLGYTGIVSFAHTMFFGIGAYGVAIALTFEHASWKFLALGSLAALATSLVLSLAIGLFSLRVRALFFAMITLAVASAFQRLASQLSDLTGGEDGLNFTVPEWLQPGFMLRDDPLFGVDLGGRLISYYLVFCCAAILFLAMLRIVNSPFGRVLQAIRENDFRAEALGYRSVVYRTLSTVISALFATMAGILLAIWLHYNGPNTSLSFEIMVDVLLIVVIGGMGTLYGSILGTTVFILAQSYLQDIMRWISQAVAPLPTIGSGLSALFSPDRWLLWLGILFVLCVYNFPNGIVGRLRQQR